MLFQTQLIAKGNLMRIVCDARKGFRIQCGWGGWVSFEEQGIGS
jgi:hypothetical protein